MCVCVCVCVCVYVCKIPRLKSTCYHRDNEVRLALTARRTLIMFQTLISAIIYLKICLRDFGYKQMSKPCQILKTQLSNIHHVEEEIYLGNYFISR